MTSETSENSRHRWSRTAELYWASSPELIELLPTEERHRWHLSGNSSQVLALGLLGTAALQRPDLEWWWDAIGDLPPASQQMPRRWLESKVSPDLLGEEPRQTAIDFYVYDEKVVICCECKWTEDGIGRCSCRRSGGDPSTGNCVQRVRYRTAYWDTAREIFGLPPRTDGQPCPLHPAYQAVRNVAAALGLADRDQPAVFVLTYDAENPYFTGAGEWPGWPTVLEHTLDGAHSGLHFRAVSWQDLISRLPLDDVTLAWAAEKHGLRAAG